MDSSPLYAQVILDHPALELDRSFDYLVPGSMAGKVGVGSAVLVPFAGGKRIGFVISLSDNTEIDTARVLEIEELLEEEPSFDGEIVELCKWVADRYMASLVDAIKLALPPGRSRKLIQTVRAARSPESGLSANRLELLAFIDSSGGEVELDAVKKQFGASAVSSVSALSKKGLLERRYRLAKPVTGEKTERLVVAEPSLAEIGALDVLAKAPKQRLVLELVLGEGEIPLPELLIRAETGSAQVKALVERGYIKIVERPVERIPAALYSEEYKEIDLTFEQETAVKAVERSIEAGFGGVFLLQGVTGSGKTEVYLQAISRVLALGKSAIVLVPEISLTPQTVARFRGRFPGLVAVAHSRLSDGERYDQWRGMREGRYRVVVGARSALFAPLRDVGIVIVDEEHESAYKQSRSPRYNARDVAVERGKLAGAPVILGSATPSLEARYGVDVGEIGHLVLSRRVNDMPLPSVEIVDLRNEIPLKRDRRTISKLLERRIKEALTDGGKVILLLNRRGFSNYLICSDCGDVPFCPKCAVSLNYHRVGRKLRCHHCDYAIPAPSSCPACSGNRLLFRGAGTQRAEDEVAKLFPETPIIRMDSDTTGRKNAHQARLNEFKREDSAILLGTQMIAKGLDFPDVTLVGVLDADTALYLPDFRAIERTYQLLLQVSGRAGRAERPGRVVIQTYSPENEAILAILAGDYEEFYSSELAARRELEYPPFSTIIRLLYTSVEAGSALSACEAGASALEGCPGEILGPAPAPLVKVKGDFRYHLLVKTTSPEAARAFIKERFRDLLTAADNNVSLAVDVDPVWVL